jgi:transforming growth factor-beta-induced protein
MNWLNGWTRGFMVAGLTVLVAACGGAEPDTEAQIEEIEEVVEAPGNIVEVAAAAGSFNTLLAAAEAAGLAETLATGGPFTVFAPTDEAFAALPEGTVEALLADPAALANILLYHVVAGTVTSEQVAGLSSATSLQGSEIAIMIHDGAVMVNEATVIATDIAASNGIIHVINAVILPPEA